jgi:hypothetical protein
MLIHSIGGEAMSADKPYKGELCSWRKVACDAMGYDTPVFGAEGYYYIMGFAHKYCPIDEHIRKLGTVRCTSRVLSHNEETGEIETINSRYKLIEGENKLIEGEK